MTKKNLSIALLSLMIFFNSCKKIQEILNPGKIDCDEFKTMKIVAIKTSYTAGEDIDLKPSIPNLANVQYSWSTPAQVNSIYSSSGIGVTGCGKGDEGWYYLTCSNNDCGTVSDSIYIKVTNKVVPVPCNTIKDSIEYTSIPSTSYNVRRYYHSTWNKLCLEGSSKTGWGYPTYVILFHDKWTNKEPEDGIYVTSSIQTMSNISSSYQVHISSGYGGIYFSSKDYDTVYVSHDNNNKLKVSFCKVNLSGSNGSTVFKTIAKGSLVAP